MILKKPYAFLIKYFKLIHFIMLLLISFCAFRSILIIRFFNEYINNNYQLDKTYGLSSQYTPFLLYLSLIIIIAFTIVLIILLRHKKKPITLYIATLLYYFLFFCFLFYLSDVLDSFNFSLISSRLSRNIRDISIIFSIPQLFFIVYIFIRAVGFDFKKFDFGRDIEEATREDSEEFELYINLDGNKAKTIFNRFKREMVYYFKENAFMLSVLGVIVFAGILIFIYSNIYRREDLKYKVNTEFVLDNLNMKVSHAEVTNYKADGTTFENDYYVVTNLSLKNDTSDPIKVDYNLFKLKVGNKLILPDFNINKHYLDNCSTYIPETVASKTERNVCLIYPITKNMLNRKMTIRINHGVYLDKGKEFAKHIYINLGRTRLQELQTKEYKLGDEIILKDTLLNNTKIKINDYEITNKYIYAYSNCDTCTSDNASDSKYKQIFESISYIGRDATEKKLIVFHIDYTLDDKVINKNTFKYLSEFMNMFAYTEYKIGDNKNYSRTPGLSPRNVNNLGVLTIPNQIDDGSKVKLIFTIRNIKYVISLPKK